MGIITVLTPKFQIDVRQRRQHRDGPHCSIDEGRLPPGRPQMPDSGIGTKAENTPDFMAGEYRVALRLMNLAARPDVNPMASCGCQSGSQPESRSIRSMGSRSMAGASTGGKIDESKNPSVLFRGDDRCAHRDGDDGVVASTSSAQRWRQESTRIAHDVRSTSRRLIRPAHAPAASWTLS